MPRPRLTPMTVETLTPEQRAVHDAINSPPREGMGFNGPYAAYIKAPGVGGPAQELGAVVRFNMEIPENFQKIASCVVGQYHQAKFEFAGQIPFARRAGHSEAVIEALRQGEVPDFGNEGERVIYDFCRQLVQTRRVDDDTYDRARGVLGETQLVELVATVAYYTSVCITLNAFDVALPEDMDDPFP